MEATLRLTDIDCDLLDMPDNIKKSLEIISIKIEQDVVYAVENNNTAHCLSINLYHDIYNSITYKLSLNELEMFAAQINQMIKSFRADHSDLIKERSKKLRTI